MDEKILRHFDLSSQYGVSNFSTHLRLVTDPNMKNSPASGYPESSVGVELICSVSSRQSKFLLYY